MGVNITPGSGKTIATDTVGGSDYQQIKLYDGTIGSSNAAIVDANGNLRVAAGQATLATYVVGSGALTPTAAMDLLVLEAPVSGVVRLQRIIIWNPGIQTAAAFVTLQLIRKTTAGTGGAVTPVQVDAADGAYAGLTRTGVTTRGSDGTVIDQFTIWVPAAGAAFTPVAIDFSLNDAIKAPVVPIGITNGIALKHPGVAGAASFSCSLVFSVGA